MLKKILFSTLFFFILSFSTYAVDMQTFLQQSFNEKKNITKILKKAKKRAKKQKKNILVIAGNDKCPWTNLMQRHFFSDKILSQFIDENFILIKVHHKNKKFLKKYPASNTIPYLYVLNENGKLIKTQKTTFFENFRETYNKNKLLNLFNNIKNSVAKKSKDIPSYSHDYDSNLDTMKNFEKAKKDAKKREANIVVFVGRNSCHWCSELEDFISINEDLGSVVYDNFVILKVHRNGKKSEDFLKKIGVKKIPSTPYLIFLDKNGKLIKEQETGSLEKKIAGYSTSKFLYFLKRWKKDYKKLENPLKNKLPKYSYVYSEKSNSFKDLEKAKKNATKENKNIFVILGDTKCVWTHLFDEFFWADKKLNNFFHNNFEVLKVVYDGTKNKEFVQKIVKKGNFPTPHIFILNKNGELKKSISTEIFEDEFSYNKLKLKRFLKQYMKLP